ncbi:RHS repeat protein [Taibaiella lutea]|uniref:RHS repeat protein n=1 Tax=Taibaiella lutea TaxID=2608001 RepID=A0A5M6CQZ3_9BACT|nr:RHS repeat domain-containing protein [Taibaiella lutea]KAA5536810.1 RHS repeat protein [Taibaiella lutea]
MRKKALLSVMLLCVAALQGNAQQTLKGGAPDTKLAPGLSGDGNQGSIYSPDLFNGTANVSVPIYSYGDKGISLSYNTAGVKVDELSGSVGLHWSLNAGGSITRVMKDVPDEINTYDSLIHTTGTGNVGDYSVGVKGRWARYFGTNPSDPNAYFLDGERYMDDESDDFIFSVGGLSFTFNIGQDGFVFTNPHTNIKIDILVNDVPVTHMPLSSNNNTLSFRVRDAQGNWYYFVKGDVSYKHYNSTYGSAELQYTSRWVVSKIVQNNGLEINYLYNDTPLFNTSTSTALYNAFTSAERSGVAPVTGASIVQSNTQYVSTKQIASISYPDNTTATFTYRSGSRCDDPTGGASNPVLEQIEVAQVGAGVRYIMDQGYSLSTKDGQNIPMEIALGSCYDVNTTGDDDYRYHRLILKGVLIAGIGSSVTEPYYTFGYKQLRLPPRFSGSQDYYGYYNGKAVSQNAGMLSIPSHSPKYGNGGAYGVDRNDDFAFAMAGNLISVKNASGGLTEFTYEGHSLSNVTSDAGITLPTDAYFFGATTNDGVRLQSVKMSDPHYPGVYTRQDYTYDQGQRFMPGGYFDYPYRNGGSNTLFNNSFVSPHQFVNGSNHGYTTVTVETKNQSGTSLSKREIIFQNISRTGGTSYYKTGSKNYFQYPFTDKQYIKNWEIGLPLVVTEYDQYGNILSVTNNAYNSETDDTSATGKIGNLKILATTDASGSNPAIVDSESYRPFTGISKLISTTTQKYINGTTFITDQVTYNYDERNNPISTTTTNSRGEKFMLKNIYNYAVSGPGVTDGAQPGTLYDMTAAGLELKVGMERWKLNTIGQMDKLFDASITCFQYQSDKINTKKLFTLRSKDPISFTGYTGISIVSSANRYSKILAAYNTTSPVGSFQQMSEVLQYDAKGNPVETKISDQAIYKSMIWDPVTGAKVADVSNGRLKDIGFTSFESNAASTGNSNVTNGRFSYNEWGLQNTAGAISGKTVYKLIAPGFTANNVITSPTLTAGVTYILTFWTKDFTPTISGAGLSNIAYTSIHTLNSWTQWMATFTPTANGSLQLTTTQPLYIDEIRLFPKGSQMSNAVYAPMAGATSTTDAQGRITYYLYDALGRQTAVKDQDGNVISKQERHLAQ